MTDRFEEFEYRLCPKVVGTHRLRLGWRGWLFVRCGRVLLCPKSAGPDTLCPRCTERADADQLHRQKVLATEYADQCRRDAEKG